MIKNGRRDRTIRREKGKKRVAYTANKRMRAVENDIFRYDRLRVCVCTVIPPRRSSPTGVNISRRGKRRKKNPWLVRYSLRMNTAPPGQRVYRRRFPIDLFTKKKKKLITKTRRANELKRWNPSKISKEKRRKKNNLHFINNCCRCYYTSYISEHTVFPAVRGQQQQRSVCRPVCVW